MTDDCNVIGLSHVNLRAPAATIESLRNFYRDVVGLREGPRPRFRSGSQGYWLYAGARDVLHLSIDTDADTRPHAGAFNHLAFACHGLTTTLQRLDDAGIEVKVGQVEERHQVQLFLTDPAGLRVELTFTNEALPG